MKIINLIALAGLFILITSATFSSKKENSKSPDITDISKESFIDFLSHFEKKELPYRLGINELYGPQGVKIQKAEAAKLPKKRPGTHSISYSEYIPDARYSGMSRMGSPQLTPVARFYPNEKMVAIIYSSQLRFSFGLHKNYNLLLYDLKGNLISGEIEQGLRPAFSVAYSSLEESITCTIDEKGRVWQNTYENVWKEDINKKGIVGNEITDYQIKNTKVFEIKNTGEIIQLKEIPTTAKASIF